MGKMEMVMGHNDVDRQIFWQVQFIRPDKPEFRHWLRTLPSGGKAHEDLVCHLFPEK